MFQVLGGLEVEGSASGFLRCGVSGSFEFWRVSRVFHGLPTGGLEFRCDFEVWDFRCVLEV